MQRRFGVILAVAVLCLAAPVSRADLGQYVQNFEGLDQTDPAALADDGWLVFGNVFNPDWAYLYGYGPFPAPNGGPGFCGIDIGQGGPEQGAQQLVVYNDYNNGDHANGNYIEANVFQEQIIGAADIGTKWRFRFDAKRGNITAGTTALAFYKVLDPNNGFALSRFITLDMTNVPEAWGSYKIFIDITPELEGQILQFGFVTLATNYTDSGIFYDNIAFKVRDPLLVELESFDANMTPEGVLVSWSTAVEIDTVGFRVLRETGAREKTIEIVSPSLISAKGSEVVGSYYQFNDRSSRAGGVVRYYLEDIDLNGRVTRHGPATLVRPSGGRDASSRQR